MEIVPLEDEKAEASVVREARWTAEIRPEILQESLSSLPPSHKQEFQRPCVVTGAMMGL